MKLGFTGTRNGMSPAQRIKITEILSSLLSKITEFHHGCCVGADHKVVDVICNIVSPPVLCTCTPLDFECDGCRSNRDRTDQPISAPFSIVAHPPDNISSQSFAALWLSHRKCKPANYLARNRDIVNSSDAVLAAPNVSVDPVKGSGTWYTIRYARERRKPVAIVFPDGTVEGYCKF